STTNIIKTGYTCTINAGSGTLVASGFSVAIGSPPAPYTVTVTGNLGGSGDFAQDAFTVTSPSITLSPGSAPSVATVLVNGTGFSTADGSCFISSPTPSSSPIVVVPGCTVVPGTGTIEGSFSVGNVAIGEFAIE